MERKMISRQEAFTLVELLVVMAIIGVMTALIVPSLSGILGGNKMSGGSETVFGALSNARQLAATKNRTVEFRLIAMQDRDIPSSTTRFRAVQVLEIRDNGTYKADKVRMLPTGIIIGSGTAMSSICGLTGTMTASATNTPPDPPLAHVAGSNPYNYSYCSFRFLPDGSMNLTSATNCYLTLYDEKFETQVSGTTPPKNFVTIQLEPATGAATIYKP